MMRMTDYEINKLLDYLQNEHNATVAYINATQRYNLDHSFESETTQRVRFEDMVIAVDDLNDYVKSLNGRGHELV